MRDDEASQGEGDVLEAGRDVGRHPVRSAVLTAVAVLGAAVWALTARDADEPAASRPSPDASAPASTPEAGGARPSRSTSLSDAGGTAGAFYAFASTGNPATVSRLWADWVTVSDGLSTWTMTAREASDRDAWRRDPAADGHGPRDLLRRLGRSRGSFSVYLEDMACVGSDELRAVNPVGRVTSRVLVAIRPTVGTPCARWWAIDLVFTPEDRISQVHLR